MVQAGAVITGLVALIMVYALAPTIVNVSENAADTIEGQVHPFDDTDNSEFVNQTSAPIFRLGPLFWALVGIGVAAAVVIGSLRVKG